MGAIEKPCRHKPMPTIKTPSLASGHGMAIYLKTAQTYLKSFGKYIHYCISGNFDEDSEEMHAWLLLQVSILEHIVSSALFVKEGNTSR